MSLFTTDHMVIDPPFRELLRGAQLDTVAQVLTCIGDRLAAWSRTTDTICCSLPGHSGSIYIKRYHFPRWKQRFRAMFRGAFFQSSRARNEYKTLRLMRELGIQAVRPVAYGERRIGHFLRSCFLITEAVPKAMPLSSFIKTFGQRRQTPKEVEARREILTSLARQVREMHAAGFVHRDLFWRNVLIRPLPDNRFEFYFLDASVGRRIRVEQWRHESIVRDIAAMGVLAPDFCSKADQLRFIQVYLDTPNLGEEDRRWLRTVQKQSAYFRESEVQRLAKSSVFDPPILEAAGGADGRPAA